MSDIPIQIENLGKRYRLGAKQERYYSLRDSLTEVFTAPFRRLKGNIKAKVPDLNSDHIWALKNVSLEVKRGEVVGIIGRNGSGKTTLLKILSRITHPTEGNVTIRGRVGSLLEVGTGFHPELTGRENIYLNGAILGMKRAEIDRKFDEIVDFAETEKFLDTPVKRYSSGMYVRLAFAVAAHLEPEILLVDEVLAVGDANFQKKCLGKMGDVAQEGRTVLFVSHNMASIQQLCQRGIVLNEGTVFFDGPADKAVKDYLGMGMYQEGERLWTDVSQAPGDDMVRLVGIRTRNQSGEICSRFDVREQMAIEVEFVVLKQDHQLCVLIELWNDLGQNIILSFDDYIYGSWGKQPAYQKGRYKSVCLVPGDFLNEGRILVNTAIWTPPDYPAANIHHVNLRDILFFNIGDRKDPGGVRGYYPYRWAASAVRPRLRWRTEYLGCSGKV